MKIHPELAPHQLKAIGKMHDGCILHGGVGSGKSRAALAYYALTEGHEDVYVITTAKKRDSLDWEAEAAKFGIGKERDATLHGVLHVDSWNNIAKYVNTKNAFFIFDEQRLVGSGVWVKSFLKIVKPQNNNRWVMLSATPGDTWLDYIPVFIANGFYRNRTEFKREHVIYNSFTRFPKVERYVGVGKLIKLRNQILVPMPYAKQTTRHEKTIWCDYDKDLMVRVAHGRWNVYKDEPIRDIAELFGVMRRVVNSDPSRAQAAMKLVEEHPRLIIFYNFNYELDIIRGLPLSNRGIVFAEWNGHKHEELPKTPKWVYVVQYAAGSEGWNCVSTGSTLFWSLPYSYKFWEQAHGRTDRINTQYLDLLYLIMRSKSDIDNAIWRSLKSKMAFQPDHFDMENAEFADFLL